MNSAWHICAILVLYSTDISFAQKEKLPADQSKPKPLWGSASPQPPSPVIDQKTTAKPVNITEVPTRKANSQLNQAPLPKCADGRSPLLTRFRGGEAVNCDKKDEHIMCPEGYYCDTANLKLGVCCPEPQRLPQYQPPPISAPSGGSVASLPAQQPSGGSSSSYGGGGVPGNVPGQQPGGGPGIAPGGGPGVAPGGSPGVAPGGGPGVAPGGGAGGPTLTCDRQPYLKTCETGAPSQFTLRFYKKDGKCCSYPAGYCKGENDIAKQTSIRTKEDCEAICIRGENPGGAPGAVANAPGAVTSPGGQQTAAPGGGSVVTVAPGGGGGPTTAAALSCTRVPFVATCQTGYKSQFALRWQVKDGKCCSYPYGYCKGEDDVAKESAIRTKEDCECHCLQKNCK